MSNFQIKSTSKNSAQCSDLVLRANLKTRLVFRPIIINNSKDPNACLRGRFIFQRKSTKDKWQDIPTESFSSFKIGDGYKLELHASELYYFYTELTSLFELYRREGMPQGRVEYVRAKNELSSLAKLPKNELKKLLIANKEIGSKLLLRLLDWASSQDNLKEIIDLLLEIDSKSLKKLNTLVGIQRMKKSLKIWRENRLNSNEEFWQTKLLEYSFIFEEVFVWPCTILEGKAYVGGKTVANDDGKIVDFLVKNSMTDNAALIEIKTPCTKIIGNTYRQGIVNISKELSGALLQILHYRASLTQYYNSLVTNKKDFFQAFDPKCVIIIGNTNELNSIEAKNSFELFRNQLSDVTVITYDEIFVKIENLLNMIVNLPNYTNTN